MHLTITTEDDRIVTLDVGDVGVTVENLKAILEVNQPALTLDALAESLALSTMICVVHRPLRLLIPPPSQAVPSWWLRGRGQRGS
jgi:hypothetical protein